MPFQSYQLDAGRDHSIRVAVERGVNQDIAGCGAYAPGVARLLEAARQHDRGIGAQMAMPRQAEAGTKSFYSMLDAAKIGSLNQCG